MAAAAVGKQQRRRHAAGQRHQRQNFGVLQQCQHRHRQYQRHHQHQRRIRRQQRMQFDRRQRGQIHHRKAEALQHQAVFAAFGLQFPAGERRRQPGRRHRQIAHAHRQVDVFGSKAQQESQSEKQHHHACFEQRIAFKKPGEYRVGRVCIRCRFRSRFAPAHDNFPVAAAYGCRIGAGRADGAFRLPESVLRPAGIGFDFGFGRGSLKRRCGGGIRRHFGTDGRRRLQRVRRGGGCLLGQRVFRLPEVCRWRRRGKTAVPLRLLQLFQLPLQTADRQLQPFDALAQRVFFILRFLAAQRQKHRSDQRRGKAQLEQADGGKYQ